MSGRSTSFVTSELEITFKGFFDVIDISELKSNFINLLKMFNGKENSTC